MAEQVSATNCPICLEDMVDRKPRALSCLHTFCEPCLVPLVKSKSGRRPDGQRQRRSAFMPPPPPPAETRSPWETLPPGRVLPPPPPPATSAEAASGTRTVSVSDEGTYTCTSGTPASSRPGVPLARSPPPPPVSRRAPPPPARGRGPPEEGHPRPGTTHSRGHSMPDASSPPRFSNPPPPPVREIPPLPKMRSTRDFLIVSEILSGRLVLPPSPNQQGHGQPPPPPPVNRGPPPDPTKRALSPSKDEEYFIECPQCRKETRVPPGGVSSLPLNFLIGQMKELVPLMPEVDMCQGCKGQTAEVFCETCRRHLCDTCWKRHDTVQAFKSHSVTRLSSSENMCTTHKSEAPYICTKCAELVCLECVLSDKHQEHSESIRDCDTKWLESAKTELSEFRDTITPELENLKVRLHATENYRRDILQALATIGDTITAMKAKIDEESNKMAASLAEKLKAATEASNQIRSFYEETESFISVTDNATGKTEVQDVLELTSRANSIKEGFQNVPQVNITRVSFTPSELKSIGELLEIE